MHTSDKNMYYSDVFSDYGSTTEMPDDLRRLLARHRFSLEYICSGSNMPSSREKIYISSSSTLMHVLKGTTVVTNGCQEIAVKKGLVVYIPPYTEFRHAGGSEFLSVNIHYVLRTLGGGLLDEHLLLPSVFSVESDAAAQKFLCLIREFWEKQDIIRAAPPTHALVLHYLTSFPLKKQAAYSSRITRVLKKLNDPGYHDFNISELAGLACWSARQLEREFSKALGRSPFQYWDQVRMQYVCAEMAAAGKDVSLAQIAEHFRFHDYSYFSRWFRSKTGMSPGRYREQLFRPG